jgi:catecholate siderophore receptor
MDIRYVQFPEREKTRAKGRALKASLALFSAFGVGSPAIALEADGLAEAEIFELEAFVVTGEFLFADQVKALVSPTPILNVPQSVSIITADQIIQRGFDSVEDIINYTPGLNTSQGEGHRDAVVFRGVRSTADFFVDGVRDDMQYYRSFYNIEQVEILRGPNALLFGRGGTGGVLNRVLKKASVEGSFTDYQVSADSFGGYDVQFDSNIAVNKEFGLRLNTFYTGLENDRDYYGGNRLGVHPTATFKLRPGTTMDVSYEYNDYDRFIDRGIPTGTNGRPIESLKDIVFADPQLNYATFKAHVLRSALQHKFSDTLKGRFNLSYGEYDKLYQNFYPTDYDEVTEVVELDGYLDTTKRDSINVSADLIGSFSTGKLDHLIVTGIEFIVTENLNDRYDTYFDQTEDDREFFNISKLPLLLGGVGVNAEGQATSNSFTTSFADDTAADVDVTSFYIQDEIALNGHLRIVFGGRFDRFDFQADEYDADGQLVAKRSRKDEEVTPRFGFIYKPEEAVSVYTSYSESFLPRSGEQFANLTNVTEGLKPDNFENYELGLKWDFTERLTLNTAIFRIEQSSLSVVSGNSSLLERVESEIEGLELQLEGQLNDLWFISAGYSYLDGQNGSTGLRPRELPEHMFSMWNRFQFGKRLGLGIGLTHQGQTFADNRNLAILPSYTRLDAAIYYRVSADLRIQLNIENLTDTLYFPNAHNVHEATVGAPIHARLSFIGQF